MPHFLRTNLKGLKLIKKKKYFDKRGYLIETLNSKNFFNSNFFFKNALVSKSKKNVLRGFHSDQKSWKLQLPWTAWIWLREMSDPCNRCSGSRQASRYSKTHMEKKRNVCSYS